MNPNFKTITFSFLVLALAVGVGFFYQNEAPAEAQSTANTAGYAWSSNIGWVKFVGTNYGVSVNPATGVFSGQAWSSNIGWLDFDAPGKPKATLPIGGGNMSGWARFLSNGDGWDGWVEFSRVAFTPGTNGAPGTFSGFAWGDDVVGWMNMSGVTADIGCTPGVDCQCGDPDYVPNPADECDTGCTPGVDCQCGDPDYVPNPVDECNPTPVPLNVTCSGPSSVTLGSSGTAVVNLSASVSNGTSPYTYSWTSSKSGANVTYTVDATSNGVFRVDVTDSVNSTGYDTCNITIIPNIVGPGPDTISFEMPDGGWMKVINPPNASHDSTRVKMKAILGSSIPSVSLGVFDDPNVSDGEDGFLAELASQGNVFAPTFKFSSSLTLDVPVTSVGNGDEFYMYVHFPAKARGASGNNLYNNNNRPITLTGTSGSLSGSKVVRLQYLDPTIIKNSHSFSAKH